eukprot:628739-Hanusia_phi.AAC.3
MSRFSKFDPYQLSIMLITALSASTVTKYRCDEGISDFMLWLSCFQMVGDDELTRAHEDANACYA